MTGTCRLVTAGATVAAVLALAMATASARAAKVIIIRDGSIEILGVDAVVTRRSEQIQEFLGNKKRKQGADFEPKQMMVSLDVDTDSPCGSPKRKRFSLNDKKLVRIHVTYQSQEAQSDSLGDLTIDVTVEREEKSRDKRLTLWLDDGWQFARQGARWLLTNADGVVENFKIREIQIFKDREGMNREYTSREDQPEAAYYHCIQFMN